MYERLERKSIFVEGVAFESNHWTGDCAVKYWLALGLFSVHLCPIFSDDLSALHDELHALKLCDIGQWVSGNRNQIGIFAFVDRSNAIRPSHHFRIDDPPLAREYTRCRPSGESGFLYKQPRLRKVRDLLLGSAVSRHAVNVQVVRLKIEPL